MSDSWRSVERIVKAQSASDGAGVKLRRSVGSAELDHHDPFLLLDEFRSAEGADYVAGFPDHPHRGFETVTYMLAGAMEHRDHTGNVGRLGPGSVQWMTAGRGIIHSEMPQQEDGLLWGFQLWVNLPARDKMTEPRYQEFTSEQIPKVELEGGVSCRVVAGSVAGTRGAVDGIATEPIYLDVLVPAGAGFEHSLPAEHNALAYVFEGAGELGGDPAGRGREVAAGELAVLSSGTRLAVRAGASSMRFLLLAARPLGEPIERAGPFVMNTREELHQAIQDYQAGTLAR